MEIIEISELINKQISKVMSPTGYKHILDKGNNLIRFNCINRVLIEMQYKNAFDLRSEEEWLLDNREVMKNEKPIYILMPRYEYAYIDTETGKAIQDDDLNTQEIPKALKYGIIYKDSTMTDVYTTPVFDIRQTVNKGKTKTTVNKPILSSEVLLDLVFKITGASIIQCDESHYFKNTNELYIAKQSYSDMVYTISECLTEYLINSQLKNESEESLEVNDILRDNIDIVKESLRYSLITLFAGKSKYDFNDVSYISNDKLFNILGIVDSLTYPIINTLGYNSKNDKVDASYNIGMLKKAEAILGIMEANKINKNMKGALS